MSAAAAAHFYASISEATLVHKPRGKGPRKLRAADLVGSPAAKQRLCIFEQQWRLVQHSFDQLLLQSYSETFRLVDSHVQNCDFSRSDIATLVLVKGVNVSDHERLFEGLVDHVSAAVSPHIACLDDNNCGTMRLAMRSIFKQLVGSCPSGYFNLSDLTQHFAKTDPSPVFFIVKDIESSNAEVISSLIRTLSALTTQMNLVLVLGVSTTLDYAFQSLSTDVCSELNVSQLSVKPSIRLLSLAFIQILLSDEVAMRLGPSTASFLVDKFLYDDFSPHNLFQCFKYALMHHYLHNPKSILCVPPHKIADSLHTMKEKSIRDSGVEIASSSLTSMKKELTNHASEVSNLNRRILAFVEFFTGIKDIIPSCPISKYSFSVYSSILSDEFLDGDEFKRFVLFTRTLPQEDLIVLCTSMIQYLDPVVDMSCLKDALDELMAEKPTEESGELAVEFGKKIKLSDLKATLKNTKERTKTPYERCREKIAAMIENMFHANLDDPLDYANIEVWYYDECSELKSRFAVCNRVVTARTLQNPCEYLQCKCCKDVNYPSRSMPAVCNAYLLHAEIPGTVINVFDWLQSFLLVTDDSLALQCSSRKKSKIKVDPTLYVQFIQAVANLQFIGYIKSSKRKSDHVNKLTWNAI